MAAKHPNTPVMHCSVKDFLSVSTLAGRILTQGIYFYPSIFTNVPVTAAIFLAANNKLLTLIAQTKGNSMMKKDRDAQCVIVFNYLEILLLYVKQLAGHDITIIDKSGFDLNVQPEKVSEPDAPVIKKVTEGKATGTYKIFIERKKNKPLVSQDPTTHGKSTKFSVETTLTPDVAGSWEIILEGVASTKLIVTGLTPEKKNYLRVYGVNSAGKGQASAAVPFIPQI